MSTIPAEPRVIDEPLSVPDNRVTENELALSPDPALAPPQIPHGRLSRWYDKIEAFVSRLSTRDSFWQSICALIWLPLAFFSGIRMKVMTSDTFLAVLPFRR